MLGGDSKLMSMHNGELMKTRDYKFADKGSQRDIQVCFNDSRLRSRLERKLGVRVAAWLSPLKSDGFAEYHDEGFMKKVGLGSHLKELQDFWPKRGPVWDGLAKADDGTILLFEAKAHISEFFGMGTKARDMSSLEQIVKSLKEAADYIGARFDLDSWTDALYQTANRLAYLYFLNVKLGVKAKLFYLIFLNDRAVATKNETKELWQQAIAIAERFILKLPQRKNCFADGKMGSWRDWVKEVYVDVEEFGISKVKTCE